MASRRAARVLFLRLSRRHRKRARAALQRSAMIESAARAWSHVVAVMTRRRGA
jgi:hypothetical protein